MTAKFPNWFRLTWWFLFFIGFFILVVNRFDKLVTNQFTPFDVFIFLIWLILALFPIISEISFFGIKVKKEVEELKKAMDINFLSIRTDISNKIKLSNTINNYPSPDNELKEIQEKYEKQENNTVTKKEQFAISVPDINIYLFKLSFTLEREIKRILFNYSGGYEIVCYDINTLLSDLYSYSLITKDDVYTIRELWSLCNLGIHNNPLTPIQQDFAKEVGEKIINKLNNI